MAYNKSIVEYDGCFYVRFSDMRSHIVPPKPVREWIDLNDPNPSADCKARFSLMSYNILADGYITQKMKEFCPSDVLRSGHRKKAILDDIIQYSTDVICLQEIETADFLNFFAPELKKNGYDSTLLPKSRAKTMNLEKCIRVDGCAIFYKTSKFVLLETHFVELQVAAANAIGGSCDMLNRVVPKDNVAVATLLKFKECTSVTRAILVCNTHLHWDPANSDVKLVQTMLLTTEIERILSETNSRLQTSDINNVELVLCGDFNSVPGSSVARFLRSGSLSMKHPDLQGYDYKSSLIKHLGTGATDTCTNSLKLASAYKRFMMLSTNYTFNFKDVIDYIFYSRNGLVPLHVLGPVRDNWLKLNRVTGCPDHHIPSDHFPILAVFKLL